MVFHTGVSEVYSPRGWNNTFTKARYIGGDFYLDSTPITNRKLFKSKSTMNPYPRQSNWLRPEDNIHFKESFRPIIKSEYEKYGEGVVKALEQAAYRQQQIQNMSNSELATQLSNPFFSIFRNTSTNAGVTSRTTTTQPTALSGTLNENQQRAAASEPFGRNGRGNGGGFFPSPPQEDTPLDPPPPYPGNTNGVDLAADVATGAPLTRRRGGRRSR